MKKFKVVTDDDPETIVEAFGYQPIPHSVRGITFLIPAENAQSAVPIATFFNVQAVLLLEAPSITPATSMPRIHQPHP